MGVPMLGVSKRVDQNEGAEIHCCTCYTSELLEVRLIVFTELCGLHLTLSVSVAL